MFTVLPFPVALALAALTGAMFTRLLLPGMMHVIAGAGFVRPNFRGDCIPLGVGMVFALSGVGGVALFYLLLPAVLQPAAMLFLLALTAFTCLGLVDDAWGSRTTTGLKGHLLSLCRGRLTTGALKAVGGGVIALLLSAAAGPWTWIPVNALVLVLSVNAVNLLDLRPGRAGKGFLLVAVLLLAAGWGKPELFFVLLVAGSLLAYLKVDLHAQAMMGDTGANALGAVLGLAAVWVLPAPVKLVYLGLLVALHLFAEKYSLTAFIAGIPVLDRLDRWGRN
ncbi:hypothetical protein [Desulfotomaculum copahuensis]|uniref:Glycosyl transferase n=1 Tax=Desulfotomaculum copahuensis TaxID=1838280 RepID=A0A1B7LJ22_9FIRM|nr:hypothetical protein [Desulfotomaculum copahuensis]OAT86568.1 hypothetical protein A6M21_03595 [Desulfotomaculum copahuensis]